MPAYDVIVIGSGFGGAVVACRLAQAGARVLVLERGRRWTPDQYPRGADDAWLYDPRRPQKHNGWLDLRLYRGMAVAQGAGVGGGSLCYSSVLLEADEAFFQGGWPPEITRAELAPDYERVSRMLAARPVPPGQEDAAVQAPAAGGAADRRRRPPGQHPPGPLLRSGVELRPARSAPPTALPGLRQSPGAGPGDLHPPRQLRPGVRGEGQEHPRSQLHPGRRTPRG